jgi:putative component of membrane protein insertase Oxa1/YidC/SpoIIIJ protein YidD
MEKQLFIRTSILTLLFWLTSCSAHSSTCLYSKKINSINCNENRSRDHNSASIEPTFTAYRLAVKGSTQRKCRLEPTCSKFLILAIKHHGFARGVFLGFARSQIKHDDGFGLLPKLINEDDFLYILDPVTNWSFE